MVMCFSMKEVGASFTGEALYSELLEEMSKIKKVPHNAITKLKDVIAAYKGFGAGTPQQQHKRIHLKLKEAAARADLDAIITAKCEMETITDKYPELKTLDVNSVELVGGESQADIAILPAYPAMFKSASLRGIENNTIFLQTEPSNIPTTTCEDRCAVNVKVARLLNDTYGIKSPISKCSSHLASGTIRRMCNSVNSSHEDAKNLYNNLHSILRHFAMSPKSSQLLNNTLNALDMSNIYIINWGSTRMAGFMDACSQASHIIVPYYYCSNCDW